MPRTSEPHAAPPQRSADEDLAAAGARLDAADGQLIQPAPALPLRDVQQLVAAAAPEPPSWESGLAEETADDELELQELEPSDVAEEDAEDVVVASAPELAIERESEPAREAEDELPPRPGWEQPGLFDEEPVDAYGTPAKLVDALRKSNEAAAVRLKDVPADEEEVDEDELEEAELEEAELEEAELEEAELEEAELEEAELDEADEAESDEEELDESDDDEADDDEDGEAYAEDEDSEDDEELDEELESEAEDEVEEAAPVAAETEVEEPSEPEVILEPRRRQREAAKPAAAARTASRPAGQATEELDPESDLVYRAGALFIQRGRVAVSMLQRDFSLDFKQATSLLDQLQEAGLIGPYLGGQRRDILLTIEEWRERRLRTA